MTEATLQKVSLLTKNLFLSIKISNFFSKTLGNQELITKSK